MKAALAMVGRFAVLALVFAAAVALSNRPLHRSLPEDTGVLTISFSHGADRKAACRKTTPEELAALPPNMRRPEICPRERPSIRVEFKIDGEPAFAADIAPSGIANDGPSRVHERFVLPVGSYDIAIRLRDGPGDRFDWEASQTVEIGPAGHRVIDFRADTGGFVFH